MGDFNHTYSSSSTILPTGTTREWIDCLQLHYHDCFEQDKLVTFRRGEHSSTIDHIFCRPDTSLNVKEKHQGFLNSDWTDHSMLEISFMFNIPEQGPGTWKANPFLAKNIHFKHAFQDHLQYLQSQLPSQAEYLADREIWDWIKVQAKTFIRTFQLQQNNWRKKQLNKLQKKRNRILRTYKHFNILHTVLPTIEQQIGSLQDQISEIECLKAGKFWRENNEESPGFLKRLIKTRESQRYIPNLTDPVTETMCSSKEEKMNIVEAFYDQLYDPDPVDDSAMTSILTHIPDSCKLTDTQKAILTGPITIEDVLLYSKRSPKKSSPGPDGLPYEILNLIVTFEPFHSLICRVYNDALDHGVFPASWDESLMSLLPKKGDLTQMKNYRPISLVNTDTKIFTRLVNSRVMRVSRKIVNENQLGFIPGRYIAENGMITQVIMEHAACQSSSDDKSLALLLDQEKAYDRINLHYLEQVMLTWGFPASIVNSIITMLANNRIKINVNGFISADVFKRRGLKQGDPISPILYNLALEPFLRSVLQDSAYSGYTMDLQPHLVTGGATDTSVNVKILCYADDTLVFIKNLQDLSRLKHHIEVYSRSSNARINYNKVETISLSGRDHSSYWGRDLTDMNIPRIHLPTNPDPIVYLGFPLIQSSLQRRTFMSQFTNKIKQIALLHSTRSLSILGRATIVNSLILSMCWYLFRVTPITKADISKIRSVVSKFMNQGIFPQIKWTILTLPKHLGGLNLIDPHIQQAALYFRWIQPLLVTRQRSRPSKVTRLLRMHLKNTYNTQHHEIPLLFQDGRKSTQLRLFNICNLLTKSIDLIPRNFSTMELNPHACLLLPIQDIFMHPEQRFKFPSICGRMKVQDLFQYNPQTHTIARIPHADMDNRFKRAANKIYRGVEASKLFLSYFFGKHCIPDASRPQQIDTSIDEDPPQLSFTPFVDCLRFTLPSTKSFTDVTTKIFRKTCNQLNTAPKYLTDILPQRWLAFWSLHLTATQRNVIYRLINKKIPHKDILHKFFPDKFDTPNCSFCASTVDSLQHFLFDCPAKQVVWQGLVREFLWPTVDTQDIFKAFTTLDYYSVSYCQSSDITAESVLIIALGQIWKCHWQSIFNQQPFLSSTVLQAIRNNVQQHIAEEGDLD